MFSSVTFETYYSKHIPKEVRGILYGLLQSCGFVGKAICSKVGGYLIDEKGREYPFILVGCFNVAFALFAFVMILTGFFSRNMPMNDY